MSLRDARFPITPGGLILAVGMHAGFVLSSEYTAPAIGIPLIIEHAVHFFFLMTLLVLYGLALWRISQGRALTIRQILLVLAICTMPYLLNYATQSADLYVYISYAEISQHVSPYLHGPTWLGPQHQILHGIWQAWLPYPAPYGPFWMLLTDAIGRLHVSLVAQLLLFKFIGVGVLAALATSILRWRPLPFATMLLLNPLLLVELVGDAHNDGIFILLLVLALLPATRPILSGIAFGLSIATKHVSLVLAPLFALSYFRLKQLRTLAIVSGTAAVALVVTYATQWVGLRTFDGIRSVSAHFYASPLFFPQKILYGIVRTANSSLSTLRGLQVAALLGLILFLLALAWIAYRLWRGRWDLPTAAFYALSALILFGLQWVQPWYYVWPLVLAVFLPGKQPRRAYAIITFIWFASMYTTF